METEGISAEHIIPQDGQSFSVNVGTSEVHIDDGHGNMKIYVPHDTVSKDVCFLSALPDQLTRWMMRDPVTHIQEPYDQGAAKVVTSILTAVKGAVNVILERHGIIQVDIAELEVENDDERQGTSTPALVRVSSDALQRSTLTPSASLFSRNDEIDTPNTTPGSWRDRGESITGAASGSFGPIFPSGTTRYNRQDPFASVSTTEVDLASQEYSKLLDHVVQAARRAEFPMHAVSNSRVHVNQDPNRFNEWLMFRSSSQLERDRKVGAAGELFVSRPPRYRNGSQSH